MLSRQNATALTIFSAVISLFMIFQALPYFLMANGAGVDVSPSLTILMILGIVLAVALGLAYVVSWRSGRWVVTVVAAAGVFVVSLALVAWALWLFAHLAVVSP